MSYMGFTKLSAQLGQRQGVSNPGALAAYIGRKKYGQKTFNHAAAAGQKLGDVNDHVRAQLKSRAR